MVAGNDAASVVLTFAGGARGRSSRTRRASPVLYGIVLALMKLFFKADFSGKAISGIT